MKFRMAPNSLFAILLRSRWWISLLVALAIGLVAGALLPAQVRGVGMLAGVPFFVISVIALWRQWHAPSPAQAAATLEAATELPWKAFSEALAQGFRREGYTVAAMGGPAADLRLEKGGQVALVAARRWKAASHGIEPLRELAAAVRATGADAGIYVALAELTEHARAQAARDGVQVLGRDELARRLSGIVTPTRRKS